MFAVLHVCMILVRHKHLSRSAFLAQVAVGHLFVREAPSKETDVVQQAALLALELPERLRHGIEVGVV